VLVVGRFCRIIRFPEILTFTAIWPLLRLTGNYVTGNTYNRLCCLKNKSISEQWNV
jgi:hypothetical protein